ncbi:MAG: hypothetical protein INQ03_12390 [Candidatus Heimdallarchaeota archaeon]|nr:hypothetical protein [Candidatus Heimdallarchaeota archaeon]
MDAEEAMKYEGAMIPTRMTLGFIPSGEATLIHAMDSEQLALDKKIQKERGCYDIIPVLGLLIAIPFYRTLYVIPVVVVTVTLYALLLIGFNKKYEPYRKQLVGRKITIGQSAISFIDSSSKKFSSQLLNYNTIYDIQLTDTEIVVEVQIGSELKTYKIPIDLFDSSEIKQAVKYITFKSNKTDNTI